MRKSRRNKPEGPSLAVIEEMADDIYSIKFILQSLGFDVRSFSYRDDYFPELEQFQPKLIIVDMMIPGGGGFDVLRGLKDGPLAEVPLLAITADAMQGSQDDVLQAGAQEILAKPYSVTQLQEKLAHWLDA